MPRPRFALALVLAALPACASDVFPHDAARDGLDVPDVVDVACPGTIAIDGRCVDPPAPHPTRPLTNARVSVTQPTLHWSNPAGAHAAHVTVCRDRACTSVVTEFDADGTSARVPNPLGAGVWFWNLRAIHAGAVGAARSATWSFHTPAVSGPVEQSWASRPDVNGDGIDDFLTGCGVAIPSFLYLGANHPALTPASAIPTATAAVGDVDGDGFTDLYASDSETMGRLLAGSPDVTAFRTIQEGRSRAFAYAEWHHGIGDFDGDGYADAIYPDQDSGAYAVARGSPTGWTMDAPFVSQGNFQPPVAYDVDADGFDDVVTAGPVWYRGGPSGLSAPIVVHEPPPRYHGVLPLGDIDGDGYLDAAQFEPGSYETIVLIRGGPSGPTAGGAPETRSDFWVALGNAGDFDGDGHVDFLLFDSDGDHRGELVAYRGSPTGFAASDAFYPTLPFSWSPTTVYGARSLGDWNNDGREDSALWVGTNVHIHTGSGTDSWVALPVESGACHFE